MDAKVICVEDEELEEGEIRSDDEIEVIEEKISPKKAKAVSLRERAPMKRKAPTPEPKQASKFSKFNTLWNHDPATSGDKSYTTKPRNQNYLLESLYQTEDVADDALPDRLAALFAMHHEQQNVHKIREEQLEELRATVEREKKELESLRSALGRNAPPQHEQRPTQHEQRPSQHEQRPFQTSTPCRMWPPEPPMPFANALSPILNIGPPMILPYPPPNYYGSNNNVVAPHQGQPNLNFNPNKTPLGSHRGQGRGFQYRHRQGFNRDPTRALGPRSF